MPYEKDPGAIWEREGKQGKWLSISLNIDIINNLIQTASGDSLRLVAFANKNKKKDSSPDYWIQMPREKEEKKDSDAPF